jgi:hypothetical protein
LISFYYYFFVINLLKLKPAKPKLKNSQSMKLDLIQRIGEICDNKHHKPPSIQHTSKRKNRETEGTKVVAPPPE